jgi:alkanesulfonate monooxygenase SsuD/methylene tetrahydromethanopterin reductase-like flavin-dependent oxidoreductase (luciferase family)
MELGAFLMPVHPPIAIAGLTPGSENHKLAGEKGYIPVSLAIDPDASVTAKHWDAVVEGAARSGRVSDRNDWRIIRDVYVAPTDAEARELATDERESWGRCLQLLINDVLPRINAAGSVAEYIEEVGS